MKKAILILLTVLLAVSCSQVVYDNSLPPEDIEGRKTTLTVEQDGDTRNLLLKFNPVPYVDEYAYSVNGETEKVFEADGAEGGMLTYHIPDSDIPVNKGSVSLFGRASESGSWSNLSTADFEIILDGIAPDVYLYARYSDKVEIKTESLDPDISYMVVIRNEDNPDNEKTDLVKAENGIITISELDPNIKYSFNVYQLVGSSTEIPEAYTTINADVFGAEVKMQLSKTANGFEVTSIPSSISSIILVKENSSISVTQSVNGDTAVISFAEFPSLEYGVFYVIADDETCVSNNLRTATPLTPIENGRIVNYKSVDYTVRLSSEVKLEDVVFTLPGTTGLQISKKAGADNTSVITISNLDSNTEYNDLSIRAAVGDRFAVTTPLDTFKTNSFAGKYYEWNGRFSSGSQTKFVVYVEEAASGSDYPYYVYFSENDPSLNSENPAYKKSEFRIMPLVDSSEGLLNREPETSKNMQVDWDSGYAGNYDLTKQNEAYKINSSKWNSLKIHPSKWYIVKDLSSSKADSVTTTTSSFAIILTAETYTSFYFMENDINDDGVMEPFIKFVNTGDSTAQAGLVTNANYLSEWKHFESTSPANPEYVFYLSPVEMI